RFSRDWSSDVCSSDLFIHQDQPRLILSPDLLEELVDGRNRLFIHDGLECVIADHVLTVPDAIVGVTNCLLPVPRFVIAFGELRHDRKRLLFRNPSLPKLAGDGEPHEMLLPMRMERL